MKNRCVPCADRSAPRPRQRGVVLVISLVFLMVMTILGITAMQGTTLDEKMAGNVRDSTLAFEAAEGALRAAGALVESWSDIPVANSTGSNGVFSNGSLGVSPLASDLFVDTNSDGTPDGDHGVVPSGMFAYDDLSGVARPPRFAIEELMFVTDTAETAGAELREGRQYYAVTALGFGSTVQSRAMLQTVLTKRFN